MRDKDIENKDIESKDDSREEVLNVDIDSKMGWALQAGLCVVTIIAVITLVFAYIK